MRSMVSTFQGIHPPMGVASLGPPPPQPSSVAYGHPETPINDGHETELLSVSWNQDYECFAAGTSCGFRIYNCEPFKEAMRRHVESRGFGIVEMLFRTNYFALVGGGANPIYPLNKVLIWDDRNSRCINQLTFRSDVRAVKLRQNHIVVVLENEIQVFNFPDCRLLHKFGTSANPSGLCCLSHHSNSFILVCPGLLRGQVRVENIDLKATNFISAHDSPIACLTLTLDGLLFATASVKGTLIRIYSTVDGTCLQEVRRGVDRADVYSIALSPNVEWLAVSSDKGTVHVFSLRVQGVAKIQSRGHASGEDPGMLHIHNSSTNVLNPSSSLSFMKGLLPKYFSSEWSFARFHLPEAARYIAAFGARNTVAIVGMDGSFYRCSFDPINGGEMVQQEHTQFLKGQQPAA